MGWLLGGYANGAKWFLGRYATGAKWEDHGMVQGPGRSHKQQYSKYYVHYKICKDVIFIDIITGWYCLYLYKSWAYALRYI